MKCWSSSRMRETWQLCTSKFCLMFLKQLNWVELESLKKKDQCILLRDLYFTTPVCQEIPFILNLSLFTYRTPSFMPEIFGPKCMKCLVMQMLSFNFLGASLFSTYICFAIPASDTFINIFI